MSTKKGGWRAPLGGLAMSAVRNFADTRPLTFVFLLAISIRGVANPGPMPYGKSRAVQRAVAIFSAGHATQAFCEDTGLPEWAELYMASFGLAAIHGVMFLRTGRLC